MLTKPQPERRPQSSLRCDLDRAGCRSQTQHGPTQAYPDIDCGAYQSASACTLCTAYVHSYGQLSSLHVSLVLLKIMRRGLGVMLSATAIVFDVQHEYADKYNHISPLPVTNCGISFVLVDTFNIYIGTLMILVSPHNKLLLPIASYITVPVLYITVVLAYQSMTIINYCIRIIIGTFPIDTTKTRLQIQGQTIDARLSELKYRGMTHAFLRICKEEGACALYSG